MVSRAVDIFSASLPLFFFFFHTYRLGEKEVYIAYINVYLFSLPYSTLLDVIGWVSLCIYSTVHFHSALCEIDELLINTACRLHTLEDGPLSPSLMYIHTHV